MWVYHLLDGRICTRSACLHLRCVAPVGRGDLSSADQFQQIFTEQVPFSRKMDHQVVTHVHAGGRPLRTSDRQARISDAMWKIMEACWVEESDHRPLATEVLRNIESA